MIEAMKQMQEALREYHYYTIDAGLPNQSMLNKGYAAYQAGKQAIAELESQEPVAWDLADKVRQDLDRQSCPDAFMRIAVESIVKHHPPQRTWVGLTEQDLKQGDESFFVAWREGARWADAYLRQKNGCAEEKSS